MTKAFLRRRIVAQRSVLSQGDVQRKSAVIARYGCALPAFRASQTLLVYMALPQEVQTALLIEEARRQHKRVGIPVIMPNGLVAVELPSEPSQLRRGPFGILEPYTTTALISPQEIGCIFIPGVAFDCDGNRLGFGRGYYDRFLGQFSSATSLCGLAFAMQIVPAIPQEPHDVRMHMLVTETGLIDCAHIVPSKSTDSPIQSRVKEDAGAK